jgi:hypothetical protein
MRIDPDQARAMAREARQTGRRPWLPLLSALLALGRGKGELVHHSERPWASVTFSGSRHRVRLAFFGAEAVAAGEALIEALPEHEFAIPGQLVADAAVVAVEHTALPQPRLEVEAELLLLDDF